MKRIINNPIFIIVALALVATPLFLINFRIALSLLVIFSIFFITIKLIAARQNSRPEVMLRMYLIFAMMVLILLPYTSLLVKTVYKNKLQSDANSQLDLISNKIEDNQSAATASIQKIALKPNLISLAKQNNSKALSYYLYSLASRQNYTFAIYIDKMGNILASPTHPHFLGKNLFQISPYYARFYSDPVFKGFGKLENTIFSGAGTTVKDHSIPIGAVFIGKIISDSLLTDLLVNKEDSLTLADNSTTYSRTMGSSNLENTKANLRVSKALKVSGSNIDLIYYKTLVFPFPVTIIPAVLFILLIILSAYYSFRVNLLKVDINTRIIFIISLAYSISILLISRQYF